MTRIVTRVQPNMFNRENAAKIYLYIYIYMHQLDYLFTLIVKMNNFFPFTECLDLGNNKKAVQEADKLLKKQKDNLCAKVFYPRILTFLLAYNN